MEVDVSVERERLISNEKQRCYLWALKSLGLDTWYCDVADEIISYRVKNLGITINENHFYKVRKYIIISSLTFSARKKKESRVTMRCDKEKKVLKKKPTNLKSIRDYFVTAVKKKKRKKGFKAVIRTKRDVIEFT